MRELRPSIGPLETLKPSNKTKELAISCFQLERVEAREMNYGILERVKSLIISESAL